MGNVVPTPRETEPVLQIDSWTTYPNIIKAMQGGRGRNNRSWTWGPRWENIVEETVQQTADTMICWHTGDAERQNCGHPLICGKELFMDLGPSLGEHYGGHGAAGW